MKNLSTRTFKESHISKEFKPISLLEWITDKYKSDPNLTKLHELLKTDKDFAEHMSAEKLTNSDVIAVSEILGIEPRLLLRIQQETLPYFNNWLRQSLSDYRKS